MIPTLFPGYILDTTTIIELGRRISPPEMRVAAVAIVDKLIQDNRVIVPQEVYEELDYRKKNPGDQVLSWLKVRRSVLHDLDEFDQENLARVLIELPELLKVNNEGPDADPHLVAIALSLDCQWTVVTRDGSGNSGMMKVAGACEQYGIPWCTEFELLRDNGWTVA